MAGKVPFRQVQFVSTTVQFTLQDFVFRHFFFGQWMNIAILGRECISLQISYAILNTVQMSYIQLYVFTVTFGKCPKAM